MYDDLVKRLRICTSDTVEDCAGCPYQGGYKGNYCMNGLITEAADAIAELNKVLDAVNDTHNEGYDVGYWAGRRDYEPKWIPVTKALPDDGRWVLAWGHDQRMPIMMFRESGAWIDDQFEFWTTITHWMPLSEPPKDE